MNYQTQPAVAHVKARRHRAGTKARAFADMVRETVADAALLLHEAGAKRTGEDWRPWSIETAAGTLTACEPSFSAACAPCGFLHLRFEEPARAAQFFGVSGLYNFAGINPYSGKWNIHAPREEMLSTLRARLARVAVS